MRETSDTRQHPGEIIRSHRKSAGLTQQAIAEQAGCTDAHVSAIETGIYRGTRDLDLLLRIMRAAQVPEDEIRTTLGL